MVLTAGLLAALALVAARVAFAHNRFLQEGRVDPSRLPIGQ